MAYTRSGVLAGQDITLRVVFTDDSGMLVSPDAAPSVYIYDSTYEAEDIEAEQDAEVYTGLGPFVGTEISTGYYEYVYSVDGAAAEGTWSDLWVGEISGTASYKIFNFEVVVGAELTLQILYNNQLIVIELDSTIANEDGVELGEDLQVTFSTKYDPLYASPDLVRAEVGPWIDFIPDDTLNLLIHWASKEVDMIAPKNIKKLSSFGSGDDIVYYENSKGRKQDMFLFARTKFCIYDAAVRALMLPAAANSSNVTGGGGSRKQLGDLLIQGPGNAGFGGSGLSWEQVEELKKKRDEWFRVVNAGGHIVPGQSFDPSYAVKGLADPDRRNAGRLWENPDVYPYLQPTTNSKFRRHGNRKHRFRYGGR